MKDGDPSVWGKASAIVHTTAEQAFAFAWLYCSNLRMKEHQKKDGNLLRQVNERSGGAAGRRGCVEYENTSLSILN